MRLASFNVENLFARPKAMDADAADAKTRRAVLTAHSRVSTLLALPSYQGHEQEILDNLEKLGLLRSDEGEFARLRKLRGALLKRPRSGDVQLVAKGRNDWVGFVELKTVAVDEVATENTARVFAELRAEVAVVVEADDRPGLHMFSQTLLPEVGAEAYEQVMVVEGNDERGIDVGVMVGDGYRLVQIRTHIFDRDDEGVIFSRDCCEYHLEAPSGARIVVLANHFKSKGYSEKGDPQGAKRRTRQATRVAEIYRGLLEEGFEHVCVAGDLNDSPTSEALAPLLSVSGLVDASEHEHWDWNHRRGTFGSGNEDEKIDYLLLSPALRAKQTGGGVFRKGVWHGPRTKDPWDLFPTLTAEQHAASDHACLYADFTDL